MVSIKPKTIVKIRAQGAGASHSQIDVAIRDVALTIDEPEERGGGNLGPAPTETAVAALVGCTNTIGHKVAAKLGVDIGNLTITATVEFDRRGVTLAEEIDTPFTHVDLLVEASGPATDEELQSVARDVAKYCPLSKLFRAGGATINETWRSS